MRSATAIVERPPGLAHDASRSNGAASNGFHAPDRGGGFRFWAFAPGREGRSRASAVWGLWLDRVLLFAADTESVATGDPPEFQASVVQLDDDGGVRLVEGSAARVCDPRTLSRFATECAAKYGFEPDPADPDTPVFALRPAPIA
jgi:hypothetical protein